jgi:hypothetical protein
VYLGTTNDIEKYKMKRVIIDLDLIKGEIATSLRVGGYSKEDTLTFLTDALRIGLKYGCEQLSLESGAPTNKEDSVIVEAIFNVIHECQTNLVEEFRKIRSNQIRFLATVTFFTINTNYSDEALEHFRSIKTKETLSLIIDPHSGTHGESRYSVRRMIYAWLESPLLSNQSSTRGLTLTNFSLFVPYELPERVSIRAEYFSSPYKHRLLSMFKVQCRALRQQRLERILNSREDLLDIRHRLTNTESVRNEVERRVLWKLNNHLDYGKKAPLVLIADEEIVFGRLKINQLQTKMRVNDLFGFLKGSTDGYTAYNQGSFYVSAYPYMQEDRDPEEREYIASLIEHPRIYRGLLASGIEQELALLEEIRRPYSPRFLPGFTSTLLEKSFTFLLCYALGIQELEERRTARDSNSSQGSANELPLLCITMLPKEIIQMIIRDFIF